VNSGKSTPAGRVLGNLKGPKYRANVTVKRRAQLEKERPDLGHQARRDLKNPKVQKIMGGRGGKTRKPGGKVGRYWKSHGITRRSEDVP